ncbi:tetratricopeptide repeat protein [Bacteroidota bacterium]
MHISLMIRKIIYIILFLAIITISVGHIIYAQSHKSDSLITELEQVKHDTSKVNLLIELAEIFRYSDSDSALKFAENALNISQEISFNKGMVKSYQNIGIIHLLKSNYPESMEFFQYALKLALKFDNQKHTSGIYNNIGVLYFQMGAYSKSLIYYQKSLEISEALKNEVRIGNTVNNIGLIHKNMENYSLAKEYMYRSLKIKRKGKDSSAIGFNLNNIGILNMQTNEDSIALINFSEALKIFKKINNRYGIASVYNNLGYINFNIKNYESALEYHNKSYQIKREIGDLKGEAEALNSIAKINNKLANLEPLLEKRNMLFENAISYANKSLEISKNVNVLVGQKYSYEYLSDSYFGLKNYRKAIEIKDKYILLKDSLLNIEKIKEIENMEAIYQSEKKDLQIKNLEKENELKNVKLEKMKIRQILSFVIIFVFIFIIFSLIIIRIRLRKKNQTIFQQKEEILSQNEEIRTQNEELEVHRSHLEKLVEERTKDLKIAKEKAEESDRLKSSFLANMSHEIRTPMNAIIGFADLLNDPDLEDETKKELTSHITHNSDTLLKLIDDIIDIAKIESGQLSIEIKQCPLNDIFNQIIQIFNEKKTALKKDHIDFIVHKPEKELVINTDPLRLYQILVNLTNNAFKFTESGKIEIGTEILENKKTESIRFFVKDTGIGLSGEQKKIIFKRFSKIEDDKKKLYRGAGLGLTISKNLVELLGGDLWVNSEKDKGSTFYFTIPFINLAKNE